ncbi:Holliday junction resolvase RecU [Alkalicoccobacillus porphyridii]|uniref:Holliday junction resolvase RecU n=1 Tax=Alkalicoccobacillus porphyridii TaxID=2597270 RepID=A0A554A0F3_9BACI|nr:Holliday junction resolvase RecU [Alkalicoccobacillus porphyridii]TSB47143.1 Holliday junction resolvase RecU [Alkalicoccobacillus porphyridii]
MKSTYANRGQAFEMLLNIINTQYKNQQIALINKRPTPVKILKSAGRRITQAHFDVKSTVDYDGTYKGKSIVFEAKSTEKPSFPLDMLAAHQLKHLIDSDKHGAVSFLIVEFRKHHKIFYCPISFVNEYYIKAAAGGGKSIPFVDFEANAYEVKQGRVSLDYLAIVDQLQGLGA